MAIEYPVDYDNTRWATYQVSTGEIISRNKQWPGGSEGLPLVGDDGTHILLLHVNDPAPSPDFRAYTLESTEGVDIEANVIHKTYEAILRPQEELVIAAENEESHQFTKHVNIARVALKNHLMIGAILKWIVDAEQFPIKVQGMSDRHVSTATKLFKNMDRADEMLDQIAAGGIPDFDFGWEPVDP